MLQLSLKASGLFLCGDTKVIKTEWLKTLWMNTNVCFGRSGSNRVFINEFSFVRILFDPVYLMQANQRFALDNGELIFT